jgi:pantoate--beta-alanine ligase
MEIFHEIQALRHYLRQFKRLEKSVGFVPTMGALHDGHLELVKKSRDQNDITICSIFVNPTQFNNPDDLARYPRDTNADIEKLKRFSCDAAFIPSVEDMYSENPTLNLNFGYLEEIMEGKFRPGHFKGVGLIVTKLFNLVNPNKAYFGTKDLQQLTIIKKLTRDLLFDIDIVPVETVRELDGLAMSSRNKLLSPEERIQAIDLYRALLSARTKLNNNEDVTEVKNYVTNFFKTKSVIDLEYFEIVNSNNLQNISNVDESGDVSLCIAGHLGKVRLIDNISLI